MWKLMATFLALSVLALNTMGDEAQTDKPPTTKDTNHKTPVDGSPDAKIADVKAKIKKDIANKIKRIDAAKSSLKRAIISDDRKAIAKLRGDIAVLQKEVSNFSETAFPSEMLDLTQIKIGDIGTLSGRPIEVMQVINKQKKTALIRYARSALPSLTRLVGADLTNAVDGKQLEIDQRARFMVVGTTTYETANGASNTVFEVSRIDPTISFTDDELKDIRAASRQDYEIKLTEEESARAKTAQEANARIDREKKQEAELIAAKKAAEIKAKEDQKTAELKIKRAKSYLDSGKSLLKNNRIEGARKFWQKAVDESPDSEAGKEAAKLLENHPAS